MRTIYNLSLRTYYLLIRIASLWNRKASRWIEGRRNWRDDLKGRFRQTDRVIWFHCSSLGEFEQGRPIMEKVRKNYPGRKILLTFFSPSGYDKRKNYPVADHVCYLPRDSKVNARDFTELIPLERVFFIKYEFWYYFLKTLHQRSVPVYLTSGNFRSNQLFFKCYGGWYRKMLGFFTHLFVQNKTSVELLQRVGISSSRITVSGDTRFDRVVKIASQTEKWQALDMFAGDHFVIVAGSTWEKDEELLQRVYRELMGVCRWIIAPHEISRRHLDQLLARMEGKATMLSSIMEGEPVKGDVVVVDTIGHLSSLYRYGNVAYIGGGFGKGIHNTLEAAAFGLPLFFGPRYHKFLEAEELVELGAAYPVLKPREMLEKIRAFMDQEALYTRTAKEAGDYVARGAGATDRILRQVFNG